MPDLLDEAFAAVGEKLAERLDLVPLDPAYRAHFADGSTIDVHTDAVPRWRPRSAGCAGPPPPRATGPCAPGSATSTAPRSTRSSAPTSTRRWPCSGPTSSGWRASAGSAGSAPGSPGSCPTSGCGGSSRSSRCTRASRRGRPFGAYGVIAYMDTIAGVWFPRGGMRALAQALADAAEAAGAQFCYGRTAVGLARRDGDRVTAVRHRASDDRADPATGCRATPSCSPRTCRSSTRWSASARRRPVPLRWSPSAVVLHAGLRSRRPEVAHHTISFGGAWDRTFAEIIDERSADERPLVAGRPGRPPPTRRSRRQAPTCSSCSPRAPTWNAARSTGRASVLRTATSCCRCCRRARTPGSPTSPTTCRLPPGDARRLGGRWAGRGHPVLGGAHLRADGPVPATQPRPGLDNAVLAGCGDGAGRGHPAGCAQRQAGRARIIPAGR